MRYSQMLLIAQSVRKNAFSLKFKPNILLGLRLSNPDRLAKRVVFSIEKFPLY